MTGAGSAVLESKGEGVRIRAVHIGTITDYGITDAGNMGAAWPRRLPAPFMTC